MSLRGKEYLVSTNESGSLLVSNLGEWAVDWQFPLTMDYVLCCKKSRCSKCAFYASMYGEADWRDDARLRSPLRLIGASC